MSYYVLQPLLAGLLVALGVLGAALALRAFTAGEIRRGVRRTGWALIPFGALAVGVSGLVARLVGAVSRWAFQLVFSPVSWAGVVLLVVGAGLVVLTRGRTEQPEGAGRPDRVRAGENPYASPSAAAAQAEPAPRKSVGKGRTDAGSTGLLAELEEMGLLDDDERR